MVVGPGDEAPTEAAARTQEQALGVVREWVDAFNRRDAEALVRLAHPAVEVYPTKLFRRQDRYDGHDGLRQWIAEIVASATAESVLIDGLRRERSGEIFATGEVVIQGRHVSPFAGLYVVRDGAVWCARTYLSNEQTMRNVGHIDS